MASVMERLQKVTESMKENAPMNHRKMKDIFFNFKKGSNRVRLVGPFMQVRTHFIAPNMKLKDKGFVSQEALDNKEVQSMINCPDWDCEKDVWKETKTCPICRIKDRAWKKVNAAKAAGAKLTEDDKKRLELIIERAKPRRVLKWNIIDRSDPYAREVGENGVEKKVLSYKIATIGAEATKDINSIHEAVKVDITDPVTGIDIDIEKDDSGARVSYSVRIAMNGMDVVKSPLTEQEKVLAPHNLGQVCGRQPDVAKLEMALRPEYKAMLSDGAETTSKAGHAEDVDIASACFGEYAAGTVDCSNCEQRIKCQEETNIRKTE